MQRAAWQQSITLLFNRLGLFPRSHAEQYLIVSCCHSSLLLNLVCKHNTTRRLNTTTTQGHWLQLKHTQTSSANATGNSREFLHIASLFFFLLESALCNLSDPGLLLELLQYRTSNYPRRARSALGVDIVLTLDVCLYVCMLVL